MPPLPVKSGGVIFERAARKLGWHPFPAPMAILSQPRPGRSACVQCGFCESFGCEVGAKSSTLATVIRMAEKTGRCEIRPNCYVHRIETRANGRVSGAAYFDEKRNVHLQKAKAVVVCANGAETPRLLLLSANKQFPNGLANSSGELGRNVMDHCMGGGASGRIPGNEDRIQLGNRPNGIYVPRFRNVKQKHPLFLRGYGFQGSASRPKWDRGVEMRGFGANFKHALSRPGPWRMSFYGFGECLPNHDNFIAIEKEKVDAWGVPILKVSCAWRENERALLKDMSITAAEMLSAAGARDIEPTLEDNAPGLTIHEMGTARMGRDPKTSVLNAHNQAHDAKNLFVTDGACMTSSSCVNPSLTYMALTARACDYAVDQMKRGEL